ncbi:cell division protein FtsW [Parvularcula flava]|uniref:Probable peptidoglycan glycosyltransferase FtsW n=1 Tax=Aquisalinus luteolus TaxID=1566827 RepID=A0A8J3AA63_9PROT|nr:putative peptidoglycan glycosyltransferase FtsW [Aquisalinus luteolus]NHK29046.1 cell division protein FtsW [Aquisalinus luteolus]GGI00477.1 cell division protein FtsW [Aquisalinus luteolus]
MNTLTAYISDLRLTSRDSMSALGRWWWSIDHWLLYATGALILMGIVLSFAAGPASAMRIGIENTNHFIIKHMMFIVPAIGLMIMVSFLTPLQARRVGVIVFAVMLAMIIAALLFGPTIKGANRWLPLGPIGIQPSEFAKAGFVIAAAWLMAEGANAKKFPGGLLALGCYAMFAGLLIAQPDYGQWALVTAVWAIMFFIAGWSWFWIIALGCTAVGALYMGYLYAPHIASRIDTFLNPASGDTYQVDKAVEAIRNGGAFGHDFGQEPGAAADAVKYQLPDSHTDFIFAVAGEEFGFFLCLVILALYAFFVCRAFMLAARKQSVFIQTAVCGLAATIGLQAIVNIGVNLRVLPAKGMTLPFISYGGSSMLATGLAIGLILALTRKQPGHMSRRETLA